MQDLRRHLQNDSRLLGTLAKNVISGLLNCAQQTPITKNVTGTLNNVA